MSAIRKVSAIGERERMKVGIAGWLVSKGGRELQIGIVGRLVSKEGREVGIAGRKVGIAGWY